MSNYITPEYESQVEKIFRKLQVKRGYNKAVIDWLYSRHEDIHAERISQCAYQIGITNIGNIAHIVRGDFCRERVCNICAWRRQAKFSAQMRPVLDILHDNGFEFVFITLTQENVPYDEVSAEVDRMMKAYDKLLHKAKIKRAWLGRIRAVEMTYNTERNDYHLHIHMLAAVRHEYFTNPDLYISHGELCFLWRWAMGLTYDPSCRIEVVENKEGAACETIKYSLKPSEAEEALSAFFYLLKGRRLVSFSGVFAKVRRFLELSDFENVLTDDIRTDEKRITFSLYKFDVTGGVYRFYNTYELRSGADEQNRK